MRKRDGVLIVGLLAGLVVAWSPCAAAGSGANLTAATVVVRPADRSPLVERTAATVLVEEVQKRSGIRWPVATRWPVSGLAIAVVSGPDAAIAGIPAPAAAVTTSREGYGIATLSGKRPVVWIVGADPRGALFGVGRLLRNLDCRPGSVRLRAPLNLTSAPAYPIRGHQLGYRAYNNTLDAWQPAQFDQYIRELALFGTNSIEGIPFMDDKPTVSRYPRDKMNVAISRICRRYGLDYWVWVAVEFDLKDAAKRTQFLADHERLFRECPEMTGVFVPGGDPGSNPPEMVVPWLADVARLLVKYHPRAKVWLSLQQYTPFQQDYIYHWIERERPAWLGGLVAGPSSPPLPEMRAHLASGYGLRDYPDVTHVVRCQFPVPWWDPAYAFTLGRECVNPRPVFYARVIRETVPYTDGFIAYSDGVHDDLNKVLWSALEWDPDADLNDVVTDYCRVFFGPDVAEKAASGLFAFERDWQGALATNGSVDATLELWRSLEARAPHLKSNWRWQLYLLRAYYSAYTRHRLRYESALEEEANACMLRARSVGSTRAISGALASLKRAETARIRQDLAARVPALCADLYRTIGFQSSVPKYHARGPERGAVLDFLNYPLNNRWWLEDGLAKVRKLPTEAAKVERLEVLAKWEHPGLGSFYDDIGDVAKSPHEVRDESFTGVGLAAERFEMPGFMWWVEIPALARVRQSWISSEDWPKALRYTHLDSQADYLVRVTGCGECFLRVNGRRLRPTLYGKGVGEIKEFPVPRGLYQDGNITVTFDPTFEPQLNWRQQSRLCEIWLIKK